MESRVRVKDHVHGYKDDHLDLVVAKIKPLTDDESLHALIGSKLSFNILFSLSP